jgi:nicotinamide-nucleotide amidase
MNQDVDALAEEVLREAERCGFTIVTAESCTGGLLASALSRGRGASKFFHGGFVTYTKEMKSSVLGVPRELLKTRTAVAPEVALALAKGALERSPATLAVAITGVAGPEPDEDGNPVGLVYCAAVRRGDNASQKTLRLMCEVKEQDAILQTAMRQALWLLRSLCEGRQVADASP